MECIQEKRIVDRKNWPPGPWHNEPDVVEWYDKVTAFSCLMVRARFHWCGYVGLSPTHPLFGKSYFEIKVMGISIHVHGGLTFAAACSKRELICRVPQPNEPDKLWWLGFDCAHFGDYTWAPAYSINGIYRDVTYVQAEVTSLAAQLKEAHSILEIHSVPVGSGKSVPGQPPPNPSSQKPKRKVLY